MSYEFHLDLDSECGAEYERALRRAPVNTRDYCSHPLSVSGCGPALDPHRRELHDVPMLLHATCEDYGYLRWMQGWTLARASWVSFKRAGLRLVLWLEVLSGVELFRYYPGVLVALAMVLMFAAGVLVGQRH